MQHHAAITMRFAASTRKLAPIYAQNNTRTPDGKSHAAIPMRSATGDSKTPYNYAHTSTPKAASSHRYTAAKKRQTDRSRTRRTHEVPFIVGCSHFTRKNTRFRAPASSPTQAPCNIHASPLPFITTSLPHHFPSSSLRHHFPSSPLPFLTTSLRHHFPSSPLPFVTTSLHHHFPSSPLPFLITSLPHHFPSSPLPFVTTLSHSFLFFCYVLLCYVL